MNDTTSGVADSKHLHMGGILFPNLDQADFTAPFEVLSCVPNSTFHILGKSKDPVGANRGLVLTPNILLEECPPLDLLLIPGGAGVNAAMEDEAILEFVRRQAAGAKLSLTVCTGALLAGAAGLLKGRKATTHWASHHFLKEFGAVPVDERVVVDGNLMTCAGVTAGLDGALKAVAELRGEREAQEIQLYLEYAPEPPFDCGSPKTAPPEMVEARRQELGELLKQRAAVVQRVTEKLR